MRINIEIPDEIGKKLPPQKDALVRIFLSGLKKEKACQALEKLRGLKGALHEAYPDITSVELQHKAKDLW